MNKAIYARTRFPIDSFALNVFLIKFYLNNIYTPGHNNLEKGIKKYLNEFQKLQKQAKVPPGECLGSCSSLKSRVLTNGQSGCSGLLILQIASPAALLISQSFLVNKQQSIFE